MAEHSDQLATLAFRDYFGTRLTPVSFQDWLQSIDRAVTSGHRRYLSGHHNLHSLYLLRSDSVVKEFYARCDNCYIDGMPIRLVLAGAGIGTGKKQRFSLMDCFPDLLEHAQQQGWKLFYLGSRQEVVELARQRLQQDFPNLKIHLHQGYLENDERLVAEINSLCPDLLLVGMGMPRQEAWLLQHLEKLNVVVATQSGATLDYYAGTQAKPPVWLSRTGLAWLYRLLHDPARMWKRYLLEPWKLIVPTLKLWVSNSR
jgi:N-acetylglucosaminyldiphosphoundecaprenol N-acetyl-beta-D-mannosaminyltransferase